MLQARSSISGWYALALAALTAALLEVPASVLVAQEVRDSAGVRILHSPTPLWEPGEEWRVEVRPTVVIGTAAGDPSQELGLARDALRLRGGRIVVADDRRYELRFYDGRGEFLNATGREGEGPGEFASLDGLAPYRGDSLLVFDFGLHRISVFDRHGAFGRSTRVDLLHVNLIGAFSDGSLLVSVDSLPAPGGGEHATARYLRLGSAGDLLNALGPFTRFQVFTGSLPSGRPAVGRTPFAPYLTARTHGDRLYLGDGSDPRVDLYAPDGRRVMSVRLRLERRALTRAWIQAYERERVERVQHPDQLDRVERMLEEMPYPERTAAYEMFLVDAEGNLWLRPYAEPGVETIGWQVVTAAGRWLGPVEVPAGLTVFQIGPDFLLGRREAEYGVHQVVLHSLEKRVQE